MKRQVRALRRHAIIMINNNNNNNGFATTEQYVSKPFYAIVSIKEAGHSMITRKMCPVFNYSLIT